MIELLEVAFWLAIGTGITICLCLGYEEYLKHKEFEQWRNGNE